MLDDYLNTHPNDESFYGAYVDIKLNRAVVEVDEKSVSLLSENTDLPIIFKAGSPLNATAKTIHCGDELRNHKTGTFLSKYSIYSAGIGGTCNGVKVIISAGHNMEVGDKIYSGWTHIGTVAYVQFEEIKPGDFSVIAMQGNHTSDAQSKDGTVSFVNHGVYNASEIGTKVIKYTENNGFAVAEITQINAKTGIAMSSGVVNITNLTITKIISGDVLPGDSGGGVFHRFGDGRYYFCGTISGSDNIGMAFSPVSLMPRNVYIDYV